MASIIGKGHSASRHGAMLRALAGTLQRWADRLERPRSVCPPLEALHVTARDIAEERMRDLRHRVFTRYY